ncbi:hypothetical protein B296_00005529 [Ensete ventricosum]|uniref:Methyltransferase n=1 Tax=Ensete ventricosum TaxID=4639 RepID=A0A427APS5_ENSVE|nr:hypothetical protein B296_00005529 [Ensete ventricosum]
MEFLFGYLLSILVGGVLLLELNRLLRPGGYFVWSATPVYQKLPEDVGIWQGTTRNNDWCQLTPVIVEVDRILRPGGHLIVRDNVGVDAVGRLFPSIAKFITQTLPLRPPRHSMRLFLEHPSVDRSATFSVAISTMSKEECPPGVHRWGLLRHNLDMCFKNRDLPQALRLYDATGVAFTLLFLDHFNVLPYLCSSADAIGLERGTKIYLHMSLNGVKEDSPLISSSRCLQPRSR